jgi:hypothetical protein
MTFLRTRHYRDEWHPDDSQCSPSSDLSTVSTNKAPRFHIVVASSCISSCSDPGALLSRRESSNQSSAGEVENQRDVSGSRSVLTTNHRSTGRDAGATQTAARRTER